MQTWCVYGADPGAQTRAGHTSPSLLVAYAEEGTSPRPRGVPSRALTRRCVPKCRERSGTTGSEVCAPRVQRREVFPIAHEGADQPEGGRRFLPALVREDGSSRCSLALGEHGLRH